MTHPMPPKYRGRTQTFYSRYPFSWYFIRHGLAGRKHNGDDYPAPLGTPVRAPIKIRQIRASHGWNGGYGNLIVAVPEMVTEHKDEIYFAHLDAIGIPRVGKVWREGEIFTWVGSTGKSTGPHLHLGVKRNGRWMDPQKWLKEMSNVQTVINPINTLRKRINAVFRDIYGKQPKPDENEYWLRRIGHKNPLIAINSEAQLRAKMDYYRVNGQTKGGRFW